MELLRDRGMLEEVNKAFLALLTADQRGSLG